MRERRTKGYILRKIKHFLFKYLYIIGILIILVFGFLLLKHLQQSPKNIILNLIYFHLTLLGFILIYYRYRKKKKIFREN